MLENDDGCWLWITGENAWTNRRGKTAPGRETGRGRASAENCRFSKGKRGNMGKNISPFHAFLRLFTPFCSAVVKSTLADEGARSRVGEGRRTAFARVCPALPAFARLLLGGRHGPKCWVENSGFERPRMGGRNPPPFAAIRRLPPPSAAWRRLAVAGANRCGSRLTPIPSPWRPPERRRDSTMQHTPHKLLIMLSFNSCRKSFLRLDRKSL